MDNEGVAVEPNDALVGRLYRELVAVQAVTDTLITLVAALKNGNVSLDRVEIVAGGVVVHPPATEDGTSVGN